jgi:hypothetical protein
MPIYCTIHVVEKWHIKNSVKSLCEIWLYNHMIMVNGVSCGRPRSSGTQLSRLEVKHSQHWPSKGKQIRCRMCSLDKKNMSTLFYWKKCDVGLCVVDCFEKRHTHAHQSVSTEWSERRYHKLWSDAVHTRVQSEQKFIVYIVTIF